MIIFVCLIPLGFRFMAPYFVQVVFSHTARLILCCYVIQRRHLGQRKHQSTIQQWYANLHHRFPSTVVLSLIVIGQAQATM